MKYLKTYEEVSSKKQTTKLNQKQFDKYLKNCPHFNLEDKPIYRSIDLEGRYYYIDPSIPFNLDYYTHDEMKLRRSAYTSENFYTLLINHLPSYSDFPKRQVICSANQHWINDTMYRIIPLKDIKIGVVPSHDIQNTWECKFHDVYGMSPYTLNSFYVWNKIPDLDWENFVDAISQKKEGDPIKDLSYTYTKEEAEEYAKKYNVDINSTNYYKLLSLFNIEKLNESFKPKNLNFKSLDYSEYIKTDLKNNELWIDKPHLLMKVN